MRAGSVVEGAPRVIRLLAGRTELVWAVDDESMLRQLAFGPMLAEPGQGEAEPVFPLALYPLVYPTFGEEPLREPALRVTHSDGVISTRLVVADLTCADEVAGRTGTLRPTVRAAMEDRVAPLSVEVVALAWPEFDIIEHWVVVTNRGTGPVTLHRARGSSPALAGVDPHLTHWHGGWAAEWTETTERLTAGTKTIASAGGVRPSLYSPPAVLFCPDGRSSEDSGLAALCTVMWGGDVRFDAEVSPHGQLRLLSGHQDRGSERLLGPGEVFETPHVLWSWSAAGVGPCSRSFHRFVRSEVVRDGERTRASVVNTWEAIGFALSPPTLKAQVDRAAELGAELFLLDDGWFGSAYPRHDDTTGLGDWITDRSKLPDGLTPLIDHTLGLGLRFGLWVEPEMVNPRSELYETHPDWVVAQPGRPRREERSQLVLDLCRPEVRSFVVDTIDTILRDNPGISYLKWDANRDITDAGSVALSPATQSHLSVDRVNHTASVMAEVAARHPDVELMLCASGGGRSDLDTLSRFHEIWTSDNTDPVDRVRIQWGASHVLPSLVLGSHVTRWGQRPVDFACSVALSARFGFDLDLTSLDEQEWAVASRAVEVNRRIRAVVQHGELHRLVSPVGSERAALAYRADDGTKVVVFMFRLDSHDEVGDIPPLSLSKIPVAPDGVGRLVGSDLAPGREAEPVAAEELARGAIDWPSGPGPVARIVELSVKEEPPR